MRPYREPFELVIIQPIQAFVASLQEANLDIQVTAIPYQVSLGTPVTASGSRRINACGRAI
jgi:hypothetical protein